MGTPSDVDQLNAVLACLAGHGLAPLRVRVGSVSVVLTPSPQAPTVEAHTYPERPKSAEDIQREYEAVMYASSEGADLS